MTDPSPTRLARLVAGRELSEQMRSKAWRTVTLVLVAAVAAAVLVPAAIGNSDTSASVGIVGASPPGLEHVSEVAGKVAGVDTVFVQNVSSPAEARRQLESGEIDVVIVDARSLLLKKEPSPGVQSQTNTLAQALSELIGFNRRLAAMPYADQGQDAEGLRVPIRGVEADHAEFASRVAGMASAFVIYMFILLNGMKITQGVAEEKSTRVVEVVLSGVRPLQLLTGKVAGVGAAAGLQLLAMLGTFIVCAALAGTDLIHADTYRVVLAGAIWLVLGFLLYCTLFAAAGSLITRQADASSVSMPLLIPLIVVFSLSFSVLFGESGTFFQLLAYFPFTAPIAMPALYAIGDASATEFLISVAIAMITTVIAFRFAAVIFERSILRTGARVRLNQIWRAEAV
ncbi:MAG: ABC transporter permease [Solirubrobacterales bacterium]